MPSAARAGEDRQASLSSLPAAMLATTPASINVHQRSHCHVRRSGASTHSRSPLLGCCPVTDG